MVVPGDDDLDDTAQRTDTLHPWVKAIQKPIRLSYCRLIRDSDTLPLLTALEDPVPQSTLIKVASKRCYSVEPLKQPTSSAAASRALRNAVDIIDHVGSSSCVNQTDVIGRKHGGIPVKLIAPAGACLRLLIKSHQVYTTGKILMGGNNTSSRHAAD